MTAIEKIRRQIEMDETRIIRGWESDEYRDRRRRELEREIAWGRPIHPERVEQIIEGELEILNRQAEERERLYQLWNN